jgi:hypothetical protein
VRHQRNRHSAKISRNPSSPGTGTSGLVLVKQGDQRIEKNGQNFEKSSQNFEKSSQNFEKSSQNFEKSSQTSCESQEMTKYLIKPKFESPNHFRNP